MAVETWEALRDGQTNVRGIRAKICQKRKLKFNPSTGKWSDNPSDRFVNEHAWVLSMMNRAGMIEKIDQRKHQTALLPGAAKSEVIDFFRSNEPFEWNPGPTKRLRSGDERRATSDYFGACSELTKEHQRVHAREVAIMGDERRGVDRQRARGLDSVGQAQSQ